MRTRTSAFGVPGDTEGSGSKSTACLNPSYEECLYLPHCTKNGIDFPFTITVSPKNQIAVSFITRHYLRNFPQDHSSSSLLATRTLSYIEIRYYVNELSLFRE